MSICFSVALPQQLYFHDATTVQGAKKKEWHIVDESLSPFVVQHVLKSTLTIYHLRSSQILTIIKEMSEPEKLEGAVKKLIAHIDETIPAAIEGNEPAVIDLVLALPVGSAQTPKCVTCTLNCVSKRCSSWRE